MGPVEGDPLTESGQSPFRRGKGLVVEVAQRDALRKPVGGERVEFQEMQKVSSELQNSCFCKVSLGLQNSNCE